MDNTSQARQIQSREALSFALLFLSIAGALAAVYAFPYAPQGVAERVFANYLALYARAAGGLLSFVEPGIVVRGPDILGRFPMRIVKNCDAIEINILFASRCWRFQCVGPCASSV